MVEVRLPDKCPKCGSIALYKVSVDKGPHHSKSRRQCGKFIQWGRKLKNINRRNKTTKYSGMLLRYCQVCGRKKQYLGLREVLLPHHLVPAYDPKYEGKDDPKNIITTCSACHQLLHWARTYIGEHLEGIIIKRGN
ncbi:HNH endonuclease [Candidatus Poribacteria bacterium]